MATSLAFLTPNTNDEPTAKKAMENEAKPVVIKSNKGRKPSNGKGPNQKRQPQRGMGVEKLERLRIQERWKKMTETNPTITTTMTQFPTIDHHPVGTSNVQVLQGVGVPMMINGGAGNGGLWGCGVDNTAGLTMQRVVGNGGFAGLNGQVLVGPASSGFVQIGHGGGMEPSKELSSIPKLQHCQPDLCDICFKKKRCNGENVRYYGGYNQFGQLLPNKGADFLGWNLENNIQNVNEDQINGFSARAERSTSASGHMNNINENVVDLVAIHRRGNSIGTGSVVMEYEFFPGKSSRSTPSKRWELPAETSVAVGGEASYANPSNSVDLSLKL